VQYPLPGSEELLGLLLSVVSILRLLRTVHHREGPLFWEVRHLTLPEVLSPLSELEELAATFLQQQGTRTPEV
jgi:hypothetical protein